MTTIGLSYSLVKISTKCAPALYLGEPHRHVRRISGGRENKGADNARQFHFLIHVTLLCDAW